MDILFLGGTGFFGIHTVKQLLKEGHQITLATRGITKGPFGDEVRRIVLERTDKESLATALAGKKYDLVCDNLVFCSNDIRYLLDVVETKRYVYVSTIAVYDEDLQFDMPESHFDPLTHPLKWCDRNELPYGESKRQAECAVFQKYAHIPSAALRLPYVIGEDDYTKRLFFYIDHIVNEKPMYIDNINEKISFIDSREAGAFLAWAVAKDSLTGPINGANAGSLSLQEIINYVEEKTNKKAILDKNAEPAPYNERLAFSTSVKRAKELGFEFTDLSEWFYQLLDRYIEISKE